MRIYSMTATFGKLEHKTLTLQPGLNIIEAPNEWGKSTWSAFLVAMLYGLDTRAKTTKTVLADKERFAPWSGAPMAGRIDLNWQGRDITIERQTKRRVPLGEFRAYETKSGLPVPELTAANCGQQLLGVEQTVFRRAGFIRHSDLPVTQDEALRRRLNSLVTTGDESGAADRLEKELKELKNRCRYNRTGLLPQAEAERDALDRKLQELESLSRQSMKLRQRLDELKQWHSTLENHRKMLNYTASQQDAHRVAQARDDRDRGLARLTELEHATSTLPDPEIARRESQRLKEHISKWNDLQLELQMLPPPPAPQQEAELFRGMTGEEALRRAEQDVAAYTALGRVPAVFPWGIGMLLALAAAIALFFLTKSLWTLIPGGLFLLCAAMAIAGKAGRNRRQREYTARYGCADTAQWLEAAQAHADARAAYQAALDAYQASRQLLEERLDQLQAQRRELGRGETPEKALYLWNQAIRCWEEYHNSLREQKKLEAHLHDLQTMARTGEKPALEDSLTYSEDQTLTLLHDAEAQMQRLQQRLGQYQGQMEALGDPTALAAKRAQLTDQISRLEDRYAALTIAQETLLEARLELQRRFAPRIASRARDLLQQLTGGRYDRLSLGEDFSLRSGAGAEEVLHDAWWRSDGTVDQLYLALRLAVAEELTPEAPLILDDALVRFDDDRLKAALEILKAQSQNKQVILFTCQSREKQMLPQ